MPAPTVKAPLWAWVLGFTALGLLSLSRLFAKPPTPPKRVQLWGKGRSL